MKVIIDIPDDIWSSLNDRSVVGTQNAHSAIQRYAALGVLLRHQEMAGNEIQIYIPAEQRVFKLSIDEEFSDKKKQV